MSGLLVEVTEKEWQAQVVELARLLGWDRLYHTFNSRRSQSGFPDLFMVRDRLVAAELKREQGKLSVAQRGWLDGLAAAGCEVYLWRPSDFDEIALVLGRRWMFERGVDGRRVLRSEFGLLAPGSLWRSGLGRADEVRRVGVRDGH